MWLRTVCVVWCLASVALPGVATAQDTPADRAQAAYEEAQEAYRAKRFEDALQLLNKANALAPNPVYTYNIGRIHEGMGELGKAYRAFLRLKALPGVTPELQQLAEERARALKASAQLLVFRFVERPPSAIVQLDGQAVPDPDVDHTAPVGAHQVCLIQRSALASCWRGRMRAGVRTTFPPKEEAGTRSWLQWLPIDGAQKLALNGHRLFLDLAATWRIDVDAGKHTVAVTMAGGDVRQTTVELLPGEGTRIAAAQVEAPTVGIAESQGSSAGPWPWVVAGIGVAPVAGGATLMALGQSDRNEVDDLANDPATGVVPGETQSNAQAQWDAGSTKTAVGIGLLAAGGAAVISGVVWWALAPEKTEGDKSKARDVRVWVSPGGTIGATVSF